jgi:hypothetical protein
MLKGEEMEQLTVWKYSLLCEENQHIDMPGQAEILCMQLQDHIPCLWALVDPKAAFRTRVISVVGTGGDMENCPRKYIGTFQINNGYVYHVFEMVAL